MSSQSLEIICRFSGSTSFSTALGVLVADIESNGRNRWYEAIRLRNKGYLSKKLKRILVLLDSAKHSINSQIRRFNHE